MHIVTLLFNSASTLLEGSGCNHWEFLFLPLSWQHLDCKYFRSPPAHTLIMRSTWQDNNSVRSRVLCSKWLWWNSRWWCISSLSLLRLLRLILKITFWMWSLNWWVSLLHLLPITGWIWSVLSFRLYVHSICPTETTK